MVYPNGTRASYTYDSLNRLTSLTNRKSDGSVISAYTYTLGPVGNRVQVVENSGRTVAYTYDAVYRLTEERITDAVAGNRTIDYSYDAVGNRLTKTDNGATTTYTYDGNDRLLSTSDGTTYSYDSGGNMTGRTRASGEQDTYQYDSENRLVAVTTTLPSAGITTVQDAYDADGNRVQEVANGITVTNYLVDTNLPLAQVVLETNGAGATLANYVYGADLISVRRGTTTSYYHYDGQMSVRQLTGSAQDVTDTYVYDAFGALLSSFGTTPNTYLYTGQQYDASIGFYYLRARYYDTDAARFTSIDPFEGDFFEPITLHRYLYTGDSPIDKVDPSGKFPLLAIAFAAAVVLGGVIVLLGTPIAIDAVHHTLIRPDGTTDIYAIDTSDHVGWIDAATHIGEVEMPSLSGMVDNVLSKAGTTPIHELYISDHGACYDDGECGAFFGPGYENFITSLNVQTYADFIRLQGHFSPDGYIHLAHCHIGLNQNLLKQIAQAVGVPVYGGTGLDYDVRINGGSYVRCDPNGTCSKQFLRP
jgi:RHS repeat-associated protein